MTKKISAKKVEKVMYSNYLKKAAENYGSASESLKNKSYNAAAVSAVHSAISSADAYCVYNLGKRCTSPKHEDAADLIMSTTYGGAEKLSVSRKFRAIIRIKNMAEYEDRLVKPKDSEKAVKESGELLKIVKNAVGDK